jgi:hypothetical protein
MIIICSKLYLPRSLLGEQALVVLNRTNIFLVGLSLYRGCFGLIAALLTIYIHICYKNIFIPKNSDDEASSDTDN